MPPANGATIKVDVFDPKNPPTTVSVRPTPCEECGVMYPKHAPACGKPLKDMIQSELARQVTFHMRRFDDFVADKMADRIAPPAKQADVATGWIFASCLAGAAFALAAAAMAIALSQMQG